MYVVMDSSACARIYIVVVGADIVIALKSQFLYGATLWGPKTAVGFSSRVGVGRQPPEIFEILSPKKHVFHITNSSRAAEKLLCREKLPSVMMCHHNDITK